MDPISTCHAAIIKVFHALVGDVFQVGTHSPVAMRGAPFKGLDRPLVVTDQLPRCANGGSLMGTPLMSMSA